MHPDQDLPRSGHRFGAAFDDDLIEPTWGANGGNLHGMFVSGSLEFGLRAYQGSATRPASVRP